MADYPSYGELNPKQKKLALRKWHQKQGTDDPEGSGKDRALKAWLAKEAAPGLTNRDLLQSTRAATRLKYGETGRELGEAQQQNRLQARRSEGWFDQYQQAIAQAGQAQAANTQAAVQGVQGLQQGLDASSQRAWAGQHADMSADAQSRGATTDPVLADQAHNASNIRNALTGSYGAMLLSQGTNTKNALSDRGLTARQQGIEEQRKFADTGQKLAKQRVKLAEVKGDFRKTYRQEQISGAYDTALKSALTQAQIGETVADTANTQAQTTKTKTETRKTALENAYFERYGKYPSTGARELTALERYRLNYAKTHNGRFPGTESTSTEKDDGKDKFGNTPKDRERYRNQWDRARSLAKLIGGKSVGELSQLLIAKESTLPPWMARAAAQQQVLGYVGPGLQVRLRKHAVTKGYKHKPAAGGGTEVEGGGV